MQNIVPFHHQSHSESIANVPQPLNPLLGRQQESAQLVSLLQNQQVRLITLNGPAGVGKTHLALSVAPLVITTFPDGIFFVDLAAIRDPGLVIPTIMHALGDDTIDSSATLQYYLCNKRMLLLLDNFEQVLAASPILCDLLSNYPRLTILVTSRSILNIRGEHEFLVSPLALPPHSYDTDPCSLAQFAVVQLFLQRAQAIHTNFEITSTNALTLAEICRQLDGLPLAIELAAARTKLFSTQQLLTLLQNKLHFLTHGPNDLPTRQRTLRNTLQWSYELLQPEEQKLFRLCSAVRGVCTLELLTVLSEGDAFSLMNSVTVLINNSLLQAVPWLDDSTAWKMLTTTREFGLEMLAAHDESRTIQNRYAHYYQQLALKAEHELFGYEQALWLRRMHAEYENMQEVIHWFIEQNREDVASLIGKVLYLASFLHGHMDEEFSWLNHLLTQHAHTRLSARAKALHYLGASAFFASHVLTAQSYLEKSLQLYQDLDEPLEYARVSCMLGYSTYVLSDYAASKKWTTMAVGAFKNQGDTKSQQEYGYANIIRALIAQHDKQYQQSLSFASEALQCFERLKDQRGTLTARCVLAHAYFHLHEFEKACVLLKDTLSMAQRAHLVSSTIICAQLLGAVIAQQNEPEQAAMLWGATESVRLENKEKLQQKNPLDLLPREQHLAMLEEVQAQLGDDLFTTLWQRGRQMTIEHFLQAEKTKPSLLHQRHPNHLTQREIEVLCLVATGLTDAQVAHKLSLSTRTISWHLASIYSKIHVSSRAAATRYALENHLPDQFLNEKKNRQVDLSSRRRGRN